MLVAIGCLIGAIALGLRLAVYNLQDDESRARRLEQRRESRKKRRRLWVWPT